MSTEPTPRTDAEFSRFCPENPKPYYHEMVSLARQLEREGNRLEAALRAANHGDAQLTDEAIKRAEDAEAKWAELFGKLTEANAEIVVLQAEKVELQESLIDTLAVLRDLETAMEGYEREGSLPNASLIGRRCAMWLKHIRTIKKGVKP